MAAIFFVVIANNILFFAMLITIMFLHAVYK